MKKINIGIVTPQLQGYGGSEIYLLECLKRWQQEAELTVYSPFFNRSLLNDFDIGRQVATKWLSKPPSRRSRFSLLDEIVVMPRIWEQQIEQHDVYFLYLFPTQMIRRAPSVWFAAEPLRMLYDLRYHSNQKDLEAFVHFYPKQNYDRIRVSDLEVLLDIIEKIDAGSIFDRLITNSRMTGEYIANIYGRKPDAVAYPGVDSQAGFQEPPSYDRVLYVGRLWHHKRVSLVLKAMALTHSENTLVIAGDGPERKQLEQLAANLGLEQKVEFQGDVSFEQRMRLYHEATCVVYTPIREPFGMVPLEAAAAGRPVVATIGGGYTEILDERAAFFVPAYEGAIAKAIHRLMSNPRRALKMGRAGKKIVEPFSWNRTAGTIMEVFRETARRSTIACRPVKSTTTRIQLGAHYYPWYRAGKRPVHWNENKEFSAVSDWPQGGPYSSRNRSVIRNHLKLASRAGLDFFVLNLHADFRGFNPTELETIEKLLALLREESHDIQVCVLLALDTEDATIALDAIRHVKQDHMSHPNYLRHGKLPMLWFLLNDSFRGMLFHHYVELEQLSRGVHCVATGSLAYNKFMPRLLREYFSGWCIYSPLEVGDEEHRESIWRDSYRDFVEDGGAIRIFTISPGYDDTHIKSADRETNRYRRTPRYGVRTYRQMQQVTLDLDPRPNYVVITSFNEFHENTHIEPSRKYGDRYISATREFREALIG